MQCPNCNAPSPDEKTYCGDCGSALKSEEALVRELLKSNVRAEVESALRTRFAEARLVEVEIVENIAKRLQEWAKIFAFLVALPLGLLAVSLGTFGISSYKDFKKNVESTSAKVADSLQTSRKEAEQIAQNITDLKNRTQTMQQQSTEIEALQENVQDLAESVNDLQGVAKRVSTLKNQGKALGFDITHNSPVKDWAAVVADGMSFVFLRATQGTTFVDPAFKEQWVQSKAAGLIRGAYHFGVGGNGLLQADHFLELVNPERGDLLALDLEQNPQGSSMTLDDASDFVKRIKEKTGKYPIIYSGHTIKELITSNPEKAAEIIKCPLWIASYSSNDPILPSSWNKWTFWQLSYSYKIKGLGVSDLNVFNGTIEELKKLSK